MIFRNILCIKEYSSMISKVHAKSSAIEVDKIITQVWEPINLQYNIAVIFPEPLNQTRKLISWRYFFSKEEQNA